jgi:hypothetical protein
VAPPGVKPRRWTGIIDCDHLPLAPRDDLPALALAAALGLIDYLV